MRSSSAVAAAPTKPIAAAETSVLIETIMESSLDSHSYYLLLGKIIQKIDILCESNVARKKAFIFNYLLP
jgi:hypothetical protein